MKKSIFLALSIMIIAYSAWAAETVVIGGGIQEGSDVSLGSGIFSTTLDEDTGNEVALLLNYTTNKVTSGNNTGLEINMWDTASPWSSWPLNIKVDDASVFSVNNLGVVTAAGSVTTGNISSPTPVTLTLQYNHIFSTAMDVIRMLNAVTKTNTTGSSAGVAITPIYNQASGDASNTDLLINRAVTLVGSGEQLLIDAQVDTVSQFKVSAGAVMTLTPLDTKPVTCGIGDIYVDTSGAYCGCGAANTWSNMIGTGDCDT